jgi:hypothetical protein
MLSLFLLLSARHLSQAQESFAVPMRDGNKLSLSLEQKTQLFKDIYLGMQRNRFLPHALATNRNSASQTCETGFSRR